MTVMQEMRKATLYNQTTALTRHMRTEGMNAVVWKAKLYSQTVACMRHMRTGLLGDCGSLERNKAPSIQQIFLMPLFVDV
jgi:hypothetical protein